MSSAILYLAIVAIWACVLVPRWLRRPHEQAPDQETAFGAYNSDQSGQPEAASPGEPGDRDPYASDLATQGEQDAVAYGDPVAWEDPSVPSGADGSVEATYSVTATYSAEVTYSAQTTADEAAPDAYCEAPAHGGDVPADGGDVPHRGQGPHDGPADAWYPPDVLAHFPGPSPHVVQARRRTLTMVLLITAAVMGAAFIGLTPWWTAVPPFVMLGLYLMLLREAARADSEHAQIWAEAQARAAQAAHRAELARERAEQAHVVSPPQPTAEIITLSRLASPADDEPYDQYADAEIRAVGD